MTITTDMAPYTASGCWPITLHHFLLSLLLVTFHVTTPCFGEKSQVTTFRKLRLCSDSLAGSEQISTRSILHCGMECARLSTCTGFTYLKDGTCNLHKIDLTQSVCSQNASSAEHFQRETPAPGIQCQNGGKVVKKGDALACQCYGGYIGDFCERLMIDCSEGLKSGHYPKLMGVYLAKPTQSSGPISVQCSYSSHVILQRWVGNVTFNVTMKNYVTGFGKAGVDYWLGLKNLHLLTSNPHSYNLGMQVNNISAFYQHYHSGFKVKGEAEGYSMTFSGQLQANDPAIPMGDCLSPLKDIPFSTYDNDNDNNTSRNCAADYGGGWWYASNCSECNLMGQLRYHTYTRVPGSVSEIFWLPGLEPQNFSPSGVTMFLYRV